MGPIQPRFRTIEGLAIRFAESERHAGQRGEALLLNPWPETMYAYEPTWARLAQQAHLTAVDLPGFGHSEYRGALMSPSAMGEFIVRVADAFGLECPHVVGPDVGTSAALFAAARHPDRFRSLVVGTGAAAVPLQVAGNLREWIEAPDVEPYRRIDGRVVVNAVMGKIDRYTPTVDAREDYLSGYRGERFADSLAYVRTYNRDLPVLGDLLPGIQTPTLIINGRNDPVVPPVNAEYLGERLPNARVALIDAGHFIWEEAADEYAALVTQWWESHTP